MRTDCLFVLAACAHGDEGRYSTNRSRLALLYGSIVFVTEAKFCSCIGIQWEMMLLATVKGGKR